VIWVLWAFFLIIQNAAFTFVSRARNSGSYALHAIAAVCSNGVWIIAQFVSLKVIIDAITSGSWGERIWVVVFYTACTVVGSISMHWISVNYIEKGKRKVGA
jgi:hypothetical protein